MGLETLPESIGQLAGLQRLSLNNNRLAALPESIGRLTDLQVLDLGGNQLADLPESIGRLAGLQQLYLGGNRLAALPEWIGQLADLQVLDLGGNRLAALPESIGRLAGLQQLSLSNNQLAALPEWIGRLAGLQQLDLDGNRLASLPEALRTLTNLSQLYLHENPAMRGLPAEILGPTWREVGPGGKRAAAPSEILDYYFRTVTEGGRPLNEAKLILVGRGEVGKTCLVNRLVHDQFEPEPMTKGIQITDWPLSLNGGEDVLLHVWDFGGQEIQHATHQFFLTRRSLYLLVLKGRNGFADVDAEYWLRMIETYGGDSPVIVVLNQIKDMHFDVNRRDLQSRFPSIRAFVETDCKDGTGIDRLIADIRREVDRLDDLRASFPASWFTIKQGLPADHTDYLPYDAYRAYCRDRGEADPDAQDALAAHLHTLGIALNYRDHPRLRDVHVLNPEWVTRGVYTIITSPRLSQNRGVLHEADVAAIFRDAGATGELDPARYPLAMHRYLLELMKTFELCFTFTDDDQAYLVPQLLDKQEPADAAEFDPATCLNFQYHYAVVPEGLLPRFIVRSYIRSEGLPRWRSGVILEFDGHRALVKAVPSEGRVDVSVSGPHRDGRLKLITLIRSDFDHIHAKLRRKPTELVPVPKHPQVTIPYEVLLVLERDGVNRYPAVIDGQVEMLNVTDLLNGVDLKPRPTGPAGRHPFAPSGGPMEPLRLFYSYSGKDRVLREHLETHLKLLERQGVITGWHDHMIVAGEEWERAISENLERADIILLLISADFMASDYCYEVEMKRALERHEANKAVVIPIILREVEWTKAPFGRLQALPTKGKPVTKWGRSPHDSAWKDVAKGIEAAAVRLRPSR